MSIYEKLLQRAKDGGSYRINLKSKNLRIGRKDYIKEGVVLIDDELICNSDFEQFNIMVGDIQNHSWKNMVWHLHNIFKYSVPSKNYKDNGYFNAVDSSELSLNEMVYGFDRHLAQAMLEGYILLGSLAGWIVWNEPDGYWFYQDKENDSSLIILREWIEN